MFSHIGSDLLNIKLLEFSIDIWYLLLKTPTPGSLCLVHVSAVLHYVLQSKFLEVDSVELLRLTQQKKSNSVFI